MRKSVHMQPLIACSASDSIVINRQFFLWKVVLSALERIFGNHYQFVFWLGTKC